ncbi:GTP-binding protein Rhes [Lingula anatina]|uniref:GTP-binding protein Rhes n=1 Tax=Lingula anatina TaxID=7574 RepID=A0A1S3HJL3_LINAN|nr:GTP-binding protein Rhes [Lingula anatina]|eukprot:XP_013386308.1 GTP-binding protein Rhes [Lingula anatina]
MAYTESRQRLVVLGSGRVGKTSIVTRFLKESFSEQYKETIEDLHCKEYIIGSTRIKVDILDTAGSWSFPAMRRLSISTADAFLLVYAYDNSDSFEEIKHIWEQIKEQRENYQDIPICISGNKSDITENDREIEEETVRNWVESEGLQTFHIQVSAKENTGILDIFQMLVGQAKLPEAQHLDKLLKIRRASMQSLPPAHDDHVELMETTKPSGRRKFSLGVLAFEMPRREKRSHSVFALPNFKKETTVPGSATCNTEGQPIRTKIKIPKGASKKDCIIS